MRIPFLGQPASDVPTPLWRHPEVNFLDWIFQLLAPLLLPLAKMTRSALAGDLGPLARVRSRIDELEGGQHDGLFKGWELTRLSVPRADGTVLDILLHRPAGAAPGDALPLVVWLHGGGYTIGCARDLNGARLASELRATAGAPAFAWASVEYRLAPEHPFPAAPLDGAAALDFLTADASRAASLGIDAARMHLAGSSAGAGIAAAVASDAVRRGLPLCSLMLDEPMLDPRASSASYVTNGATTVASPAWLRWSWEVYHNRAVAGKEEGAARESARFVMGDRLLAPDRLRPSHPRTVVVTASADALRDEGVAYAEAVATLGRLGAHVQAKGSHVIGLSIDHKARRQLFEAWAALLGGREGHGDRREGVGGKVKRN